MKPELPLAARAGGGHGQYPPSSKSHLPPPPPLAVRTPSPRHGTNWRTKSLSRFARRDIPTAFGLREKGKISSSKSLSTFISPQRAAATEAGKKVFSVPPPPFRLTNVREEGEEVEPRRVKREGVVVASLLFSPPFLAAAAAREGEDATVQVQVIFYPSPSSSSPARAAPPPPPPPNPKPSSFFSSFPGSN